LKNLFFEFSGKDAVLIHPVFGFRLFGLFPVPQCLDADFVVFTQGVEFSVFLDEMSYGMALSRKFP
jgi:hypothetical protein